MCFASCKAPKEKPPIPFGEMKELMFDIHLAETYSQGLGDTTGNKFDKNYDSLAVFYSSIFKHHKITFDEFNKALEWYRERPAQMDSLYAGILDQLNTLKAKEGIKDIDDDTAPPQTATSDSLKNAGTPKDTLTKADKEADTSKTLLRKAPTTQQEL